MQYALQIFENEDHRPLRTVMIDGEPWFVLADACRMLDMSDKKGGYGHHADRLDDDEKKLILRSSLSEHPPFTVGGAALGSTTLLAISESGFFSLILGSSKPEAKKIRKWVTGEVLPSLRRTGTYSLTPSASLQQWQPFHDRISLTLTKVPEGYFCLFKEMAELTAQLITQGVVVNDETIPEISPAMSWSKEWEFRGYNHEYGARTKFEHSYPAYFRQAKSNPQWVWCYPEEALGVFRRWLRNVYLPTAYPKYLQGKVRKGDIPAIVADSALKAISATKPKPLR